jgi:hypothetical protein
LKHTTPLEEKYQNQTRQQHIYTSKRWRTPDFDAAQY